MQLSQCPSYLDGLKGNIQGSERGKIRIPRAVASLWLLIPISSHHLSSSVDDDSALHHPNRLSRSWILGDSKSSYLGCFQLPIVEHAITLTTRPQVPTLTAIDADY